MCVYTVHDASRRKPRKKQQKTEFGRARDNTKIVDGVSPVLCRRMYGVFTFRTNTQNFKRKSTTPDMRVTIILNRVEISNEADSYLVGRACIFTIEICHSVSLAKSNEFGDFLANRKQCLCAVQCEWNIMKWFSESTTTRPKNKIRKNVFSSSNCVNRMAHRDICHIRLRCRIHRFGYGNESSGLSLRYDDGRTSVWWWISWWGNEQVQRTVHRPHTHPFVRCSCGSRSSSSCCVCVCLEYIDMRSIALCLANRAHVLSERQFEFRNQLNYLYYRFFLPLFRFPLLLCLFIFDVVACVACGVRSSLVFRFASVDGKHQSCNDQQL